MSGQCEDRRLSFRALHLILLSVSLRIRHRLRGIPALHQRSPSGLMLRCEEGHLRLRALRMDRRHVFMPLFCREFIHAAKILIISQIAKETTQKHFCFFTTSQSAGSQSTLSSWSLESHLAASCSFSSKCPFSIRHQKQCIVKWNFG